MDYKNEICPVCAGIFEDGDDIVVCPECGTPHHRACWAINNRCANEVLHSDGFEWHKKETQNPESSFVQNESQQTSGEENPQGNTGTPFVMPDISFEDMNEDRFESLCMSGINADKNDNLDGMRIGDIAVYIQQNARHYINKFIKHKGISFNWAALIFSPAWFFYRKLYKAGAIFLAVTVAVSLFTYPMASSLVKEQDEILSLISTDENGEELSRDEIYKAVSENPEYMTRMTSYLKRGSVFLAANVLPHIIAALCANEIYKRKIRKELEIINSTTEDRSLRQALIVQRGRVSFLWGAVVFIAADYIAPVLMQAGNFFKDLF